MTLPLRRMLLLLAAALLVATMAVATAGPALAAACDPTIWVLRCFWCS